MDPKRDIPLVPREAPRDSWVVLALCLLGALLLILAGLVIP